MFGVAAKNCFGLTGGGGLAVVWERELLVGVPRYFGGGGVSEVRPYKLTASGMNGWCGKPKTARRRQRTDESQQIRSCRDCCTREGCEHHHTAPARLGSTAACYALGEKKEPVPPTHATHTVDRSEPPCSHHHARGEKLVACRPYGIVFWSSWAQGRSVGEEDWCRLESETSTQNIQDTRSFGVVRPEGRKLLGAGWGHGEWQ